MKYLLIIFLVIIVSGLVANRELARDKKRIKSMIREYSFRTYSPEDVNSCPQRKTKEGQKESEKKKREEKSRQSDKSQERA